ncbi:MAG: hypothetical protein JXA07_11970 [Spirochaetes bacterium]|nr:hypothetical protein [Spirochaetota bacterium]
MLKSGATIKGKLIERNDEQIVLQDPATRQNRVIKSIFILSVTLDLDEQKIDEKQQKKKERRVAEEKAVEEGGIISVIQPQVGLMPGVALPVGKIADRIKIGGGFYVFSDVGIPKMPDIFKLRLGLALGFYYHTTSGTDYASSIMHLPLTPYAKFQFIAPYGLKPYLKLGGGIIPVLAGGASDMAPGLVAGVGLGYTHEKIPYLEFFFEAGFMMVFESIRGDYVTINLGAAYRFGVPGPSMK